MFHEEFFFFFLGGGGRVVCRETGGLTFPRGCCRICFVFFFLWGRF